MKEFLTTVGFENQMIPKNRKFAWNKLIDLLMEDDYQYVISILIEQSKSNFIKFWN